ncbi:MAG: carbohydrate-binding family 9-like protein [Sandaracinaceae bacterium]|nr:carbohydrate-binding family 9-like protein [Sandaracinaceae bacterium]
MGRNALILSTSLLVALGCVERAPELSPADRERLREHVSTEAPTPQHTLDVRFDNGLRLLGYDVSAESMRPGATTTITWYWHATQNLDGGWQLFTHVADSTGESRFNQDRQGVVREIYQPGRWQPGQYIRDVQEIALPADWNNDRAIFFIGLWNGPHRLAVRQGPHDAENRVRALELPVAGGPSAARAPTEEGAPEPPVVRPPPTIRAARAEGITIDGNASEPAWAQAQETSAFVNTLTGGPAELEATARVLWDDEALYVAWRIADDFVANDLTGRDAHLWEQDAFEIMLDPSGQGRGYYELQVSPTGALFDTRYDSRRQPQPFGHVDWSPEVRVAVSVDGRANDDAADRGWGGEIRIPWAQLGQGVQAPSGGQTWRMNFYVMDKRQGGALRSAGWSPTLVGDFHVPDRFGRVTFQAPAPPPAEVALRPSDPPLLPTPVQIRPTAAAALQEAIERGAVRDPRSLTNAPTPVHPRR